MIEFVSGNLLEADAEALVNTVNCVGVMGKGIALQFKQAFPENTRAYERACRRKELQPGKMLVVPTGRVVNPRFVINFPTKKHWKGKSRIEFINSGLAALTHEIECRQIKSVAIPPLGCGNGGLNWSDVLPLIKNAFVHSSVHVLVFGPASAPVPSSMPVADKKRRITRARALFVKLIQRYGGPGYRVSRLEIQKLAYFLQESGEPLKLAFVKDKFGPYAENLNFVLQNMEGHLIRGYGDRSNSSQIELLPEASEEADAFIANDAEARQRLEDVGRLIEGFETPHGLELLATVHWVAKKELPLATDPQLAVTKVHSWNARKQRVFRAEHIQIAWRRIMGEAS
ncbi:MAG TPA: macro domain-containing protein [Gemmataceae bacterium]|nr:macro domain-containing protein [Pirellulales bacterium]HZZ81215.1 macro domain-containing protein [Gemmataceae bacterium]